MSSKLLERMQKDRKEREERRASAQRRTYPLSKQKECVIRLFPNKKDKDALNFMDFGQHFVRENAVGKPSVVQCVLMSNPEHICPVCNAYAEAHAVLKDRGLEAATSPEMKNLESSRATRRILWAGMVAESKADGSYKWSDPVVFEIPPKAFEQIITLYEDSYENYSKDAMDQETGFPFHVKKSGTGFDTVYTVKAMPKDAFAIDPAKVQAQEDLAPFVTDMKITDMMTCVARLNKIAGVSSRTVTPTSLGLAPEIFEAIGGKSAPTLADKTLSAAASSIDEPVIEKSYDENVVDMDIDSAMGDDVTFSADEKAEIEKEVNTPAPKKTNDELDDLLGDI